MSGPGFAPRLCRLWADLSGQLGTGTGDAVQPAPSLSRATGSQGLEQAPAQALNSLWGSGGSGKQTLWDPSAG